MTSDQQSSGGDGPLPSIHTKGYWLWARRQQGTYPDPSEANGKWMVFVSVDRVDAWWAIIKQATEQGLLGSSAKVATARPNPNALNSHERVICVYTYDGYDRTDVSRVRSALREAGVTWRISYKLDSTTLAGQYSFTGARVSLYRE